MMCRIPLVLAALVAVTYAGTDLDREIESYLAQEPAPKAEKPWDIGGNFGLTITAGNSDTLTITGGIDAKRQFGEWALLLTERSIYAESNSVQSANRHVFTERLDRKLSEKASIFQEFLAEHDSEADLRYRLLLTGGYARNLVEKMGTFDGETKTKYSLGGELGIGVKHDNYETNERTSLMGHAGVTVLWQINKYVRMDHRTVFYPDLSNGGEFLLNSETKLSTPVGDNMELNMLFLFTYNSDPQPGKKKDDIVFAITLTVKFT